MSLCRRGHEFGNFVNSCPNVEVMGIISTKQKRHFPVSYNISYWHSWVDKKRCRITASEWSNGWPKESLIMKCVVLNHLDILLCLLKWVNSLHEHDVHLFCRVLARTQSGDSKHSLRVVSRERIPLNMTAKMVDNPNYPVSLFQDDPTNDNTNRTGSSF